MRGVGFLASSICKTVLWPFFHLNLEAFSKAELVFKESFYVFGARHCVFIGLVNFL